MPHPGIELQGKIFEVLSTSPQLSALIGAGNIFDEVPKNHKPPYVVFAKSIHADWSTDSENGMEHEVEIHSWSHENGRKQVFQIQEILIQVIGTLAGQMTNHHLVNITHEQSEIEARDKNRAFRGISRFRAVTEPV